MFVRKDHPLLDEIFRTTQRVFEGGFFVKWYREVQFNVQEDRGLASVKTFRLESLGASILAFIVAMTFTVWAFLSELLVQYILKKRKPSRFWILFDKVLDDNRYIMKKLCK